MKKGVSPIIATVILIAITVSIAFIIFSSANDFLTQLSPPADCTGVFFKAGIYKSNSGYTLEVTNEGNKEIKGFNLIISDESIGESDLIEIPINVKFGQSASQEIEIKRILDEKNLFLIPIINNIQDSPVSCADAFAKKVNIIN